LDRGINLIDTARAYGDSEEIIGLALDGLSSLPYVVSKILLSPDATQKDLSALRQEILASIESSLRALRLECIDLLLIHNATVKHAECFAIRTCLDEARRQGKIRFFGASCYGEEAPMAILQTPSFRALQLPFNLLDQRMNKTVFPTAAHRGVGIFVRSAYLRGLLTGQVHSAPARLARLKRKGLHALALLQVEVDSLAEAALRFCLSSQAIYSVVIGVKSVAELEANLADASRGPLPEEQIAHLKDLSLEDDPLVDTRSWQDLI